MSAAADPKADARHLFGAALRAARPDVLTRRVLRALEAHRAGVPHPPLSSFRDIGVIALGKAASGLARGAAHLPGLRRGLVVGPAGSLADVPGRFTALAGEHPVPGPGSFRAGQALLDFARGTSPDELLLVLLSGGGSAMAAVPRPGLSPSDKALAHRVLLGAGLGIEAINAVRAALSDLKGGGLARARGTGPLLTLVLLDVPADRPWACASGPTMPIPDAAESPRDLVQRLGLALPAAALACIAAAPGPAVGASPLVAIGDARMALRGAARAARARGYRVRLSRRRVTGDATRFGNRLGGHGVRIADQPATALLFAGETRGPSGADPRRGGRCQQVALAAALAIAGKRGIAILAAGTDGLDGGTGAAGALVDGGTVDRMRAAGVDPWAALRQASAGPALAAAGDLILTGPTGTNVNDLYAVVAAPAR